MASLDYIINNQNKIKKINDKIQKIRNSVIKERMKRAFLVSALFFFSILSITSFFVDTSSLNWVGFFFITSFAGLFCFANNAIDNEGFLGNLFDKLFNKNKSYNSSNNILLNKFFGYYNNISHNNIAKIKELEKTLDKEDINFISEAYLEDLRIFSNIYYDGVARKYIENNDIEVLERDRIKIFKIIDLIAYEDYKEELIKLYLKKINVEEEEIFESEFLNKVNKSLDKKKENEKIEIKNNSKMIKQI